MINSIIVILERIKKSEFGKARTFLQINRGYPFGYPPRFLDFIILP